MWKLHPSLQDFIPNSFLDDPVHSFLNILNGLFIKTDRFWFLQEGEDLCWSLLPHRNIMGRLPQASPEGLESSEV